MKGKFKDAESLVKDLTTFPNNQKIITHTDHAEHVAVLQNSLGFTGELIRRELAAAGAVASNLLERGQKDSHSLPGSSGFSNRCSRIKRMKYWMNQLTEIQRSLDTGKSPFYSAAKPTVGRTQMRLYHM